MLWKQGRRSDNVEDQRGANSSGGFGQRMPMGARRAGIGGGLGMVVLVLLALAFGIDPSMLLQTEDIPGGGPASYGSGEQASPPARQSPAEAETVEFVKVVLGDTEDVWRQAFGEIGQQYQDPTLVLFSGAVQSACGFASAAVGPFYCPRDRKVYLDLDFFEELQRRFRAPGDFAQAYVIAHEVGHHVQNLLGIAPRVEAARRQASDDRRQPAICDDGVAGRLLRRCLGEPRERGAPDPSKRRHRRGAERSLGDRRRPHPAAGSGPRRAGLFHPRLIRTARPLVSAGSAGG